MKLYEIDAQLKSIFSQIEEAEGEVSDELLEQLEAVELAREQKLDNYGFVYVNLTAEIDAMKAERARLVDAWTQRIEKKEKELDRFLAYLGRFLQPDEVHKSSVFTIKRTQSTASDVFDESILPAKYKSIKQVESVDKRLILQELKNGIQIPGAQLKVNSKIVIK